MLKNYLIPDTSTMPVETTREGNRECSSTISFARYRDCLVSLLASERLFTWTSRRPLSTRSRHLLPMCVDAPANTKGRVTLPRAVIPRRVACRHVSPGRRGMGTREGRARARGATQAAAPRRARHARVFPSFSGFSCRAA